MAFSTKESSPEILRKQFYRQVIEAEIARDASQKPCVLGTLEREVNALVQSVDCGCLSEVVFGTPAVLSLSLLHKPHEDEREVRKGQHHRGAGPSRIC